MQFHLNGFKPGNYQVPDAARKPYPNPKIEELPSQVDVLIIGTGPAGLTMARQMSEFADIKTCIADMAPGPLLFGRADGISCRTIEIMEAFNSSEMVVKESYQLKQNAFWEPDEANPENIKRTEKIADARAGLPEFTHSIVNQARLHELLTGDGAQEAKIEAFMQRQSGFVSGTSIEYFPSYICTGLENQHLATGYKIGQRFHSAEAIRVVETFGPLGQG